MSTKNDESGPKKPSRGCGGGLDPNELDDGEKIEIRTVAKSDYERKVVLCPRGKDRREVTINEITVPDLWHDYESLIKCADWLDGELMNPTKNTLISDRANVLRRIAERVKETWHLALDMKKNLAGDV
jgi:hypothetical protein